MLRSGSRTAFSIPGTWLRSRYSQYHPSSHPVRNPSTKLLDSHMIATFKGTLLNLMDTLPRKLQGRMLSRPGKIGRHIEGQQCSP